MPKGNGDKKVFMDEGNLISAPSPELKEHMKKIRILSNQHRLNDDETDLKPSATIKQSIGDLR